MANLTDIANEALALLGEPQIASIDGPDENAKVLRAVLPSVVQEVQSEFPWRELRTRITLSSLPDAAPDGWNRYPLPTDFLLSFTRNETFEYRVFGGSIESPAGPPLSFEYIREENDHRKWSPELRACVTNLLASRVAMTITQSPELEQRFFNYYRQHHLPKAKHKQSKSNRPRRFYTYDKGNFRWRRARKGRRFPR